MEEIKKWISAKKEEIQKEMESARKTNNAPQLKCAQQKLALLEEFEVQLQKLINK